MIDLVRALVVDPSELGRGALAAVLEPRCPEVVQAASCPEAIEVLRANPDFSLVVAEVALPDPAGLELLAWIAEMPAPRPQVLIVTARAVDGEDLRAADLGADGYLTKPVLFRDIARVLKRSQGAFTSAARRVRSRPVGTAYLVEARSGDFRSEEQSHMAWDIHDLSLSGAFLETKGPLPVGQEVTLSLVVEARPLRVRAKVVRVQEPSWDHVAGVGVAFESFDEDADRAALAAFIDSRP